jgi:hypothetical protein
MKNDVRLNHEAKVFSRGAALFFFLWGTYFLLKGEGRYVFCYLLSFILFFSGIFLKGIFKKFYVFLRKPSEFLAGIILKAALGIVFYLLITPLGIFLRLFCRNALRGKGGKEKDSYWIKMDKEEFYRSGYERQF